MTAFRGGAHLLPSSFSGHERNHFFLSQQGKQFTDLGSISGLDHIGDSRSFATLDYDRDGWLDFVLVNANAPMVKLYRNQMGLRSGDDQGGIIAVRLVGGNQDATPSHKWSNRDGIGARITLEAGELNLLRELRAGEGLAAQNSATMLIGVGSAAAIDTLTIHWPGGTKQTQSDIPIGSLVTVYENPKTAPAGQPFAIEPYHRNVRSGPPAAHQLTSRRFTGKELNIHPPGPPATLRLFTSMATWCPACKLWQTQVRALSTEFSKEEIQIYGAPIDPEDTSEKLDAYIAEHHPAYEMLRNLSRPEVEAITAISNEKFGTGALPTTVVTDPNGIVLLVTSGLPNVSDLRRLLSEKNNGKAQPFHSTSPVSLHPIEKKSLRTSSTPSAPGNG